MPLLFEGKKFTNIISDFKSFINAYIADFDKPQYDNCIILVFNTKQKDLPATNQKDHYTRVVKSNELYFYVYEIPTDLSDEYTKWLFGKYSTFTDRTKQIILNFWEAGKTSLLYGVLYKTGAKIKKFFKDNFDKDFSEKWSDPEGEWWFDPILSKEIFGTE
jgi:hypothetical protein